jgi:hypothetical protein
LSSKTQRESQWELRGGLLIETQPFAVIPEAVYVNRNLAKVRGEEGRRPMWNGGGSIQTDERQETLK